MPWKFRRRRRAVAPISPTCLRPTRVCPLSIEVARFGINVNTITPGYIDTQRLEKVFSTGEKPAQQMRSDLEHEVPLGRIGTVEDIASLVALLVSPRGSYITGAVIPVDGGLLRAVR